MSRTFRKVASNTNIREARRPRITWEGQPRGRWRGKMLMSGSVSGSRWKNEIAPSGRKEERRHAKRSERNRFKREL